MKKKQDGKWNREYVKLTEEARKLFEILDFYHEPIQDLYIASFRMFVHPGELAETEMKENLLEQLLFQKWKKLMSDAKQFAKNLDAALVTIYETREGKNIEKEAKHSAGGAMLFATKEEALSEAAVWIEQLPLDPEYCHIEIRQTKRNEWWVRIGYNIGAPMRGFH